ncbi:molybdate ABC transporter substrate-binding protein [Demequina flava]|uniref:molybdate ABC transporter substrate-binding protein n=1 Tax=Demequina flava TaxID=1095025 RepID=UPI00078406B2|nr:molybdate ABC transporter substrate-binding protein [Demequina flava]
MSHVRRGWVTARRLALVTAAGAVALTATACSSEDEADVLTVHTAASLGQVMDRLADDFEATRTAVDVRLNVGGSSSLATQILEGAGGDAFASANAAQMARVNEDGLAPEPLPLASSTLTIAVTPGNPHGIESIADLDNPDLDVVTCAVPVPCGELAQATADAADVELTPVSEELAVTDVLAKVTTGQADAGLVYVTDVIAADGESDEVPVSDDPDVYAAARTTYPIARLTTAGDPALADTFVAYVLSEPGQATLREFGFGPP